MKLLLSTMFLAACYIGHSQTFSEIFKAAAFDRESEDRLGYSVDISGDYAIIGAYGDDFGGVDPNMGSAYIFEKTGIDNWEFVQKINNSDQDDYDRFGWSVAIHGDFAVIGAYGEDEDENDENTLSKAGSIYVFERDGAGVWNEMQKLVASDREADDEFGWSVDIYDSTVIVGAHHQGYDELGGDFEYHAGAMYVFDLDPLDGTWSETQKIVPSHRADDHVYPGGRPDPDDEDFSDLFGGSVAIWGDYIVAGSHMHDYGAGGVGTGYLWNAGKAYVFERTAGVWSETEVLLPNIRKAYDRFGYAVDIDSSLIVVGVYSEDESEFEAAPLMNAGAAYIYERDDLGDWTQIQKLDASDRTAGDHFGVDVAIDNDYLVIGARQEDLNEDGDFDVDSLSNAGAAYIFEKDVDGVWAEIQKIVNSDRDEEDYFGESVSISEHTVFAGAWQQDLDSAGADYAEDAGAGYFFSYLVCEEEFFEAEVSICAGETYEIGESAYTMNGTYVDTLLNEDACDSIVTTILTVIEPLFFTQEISICSGTSYEIGDNIYDETGEYEDTLVAMSGCDSIVYTLLTIEPAITHDQEIHLCFGEVYEIGASIYTESGIYEDSLTTDEGCDSIVTTDLFIEEENLYTQEIALCADETLIVGDSEYAEAGEYIDTLVSATFCDSIVTSIVEILPAIDVSIEIDVITLSGGDPTVETTTFQWLSCDPYAEIDGATDQTYTPTENGNYAVIVTDGDCSDTSDCVTVDQVGLADYSNNLISVYPNPNNGSFTVEIGNLDYNNLNVTVVNHLGKLVYEGVLNQKTTLINLEHIASGIYIAKITDGKNTIVKKISIQ